MQTGVAIITRPYGGNNGNSTEIPAVTRAAKHPSPDSDGIYTDFGFFKARAMRKGSSWFRAFGKRIHCFCPTGKNSTVLYTVYLINDFFEYERFYYTSAIL